MKRTRGMHSEIYPLFFIATKGKAISLLVIGIRRHVHFVGRKVMWSCLIGSRKPHAICQIFFRGRTARWIMLTNNELISTWRREEWKEYQEANGIFPTTISWVEINMQSFRGLIQSFIQRTIKEIEEFGYWIMKMMKRFMHF